MQSAIVSLHGTRVGQLSRVSDDFDFRFEFDPSYLSSPDRPTLGQIFEDRLPEPIVTSGLPCWFAHVLPQGPSRELYQKWQGLDRDDDDDFDLLVAIGTDLPGAVELHPAEGGLRSPATRRRPAPREDGTPRFGLAGAQIKLSVRRDGARGLVVPTQGHDGDYIAKFHDPQYAGLPRLEHATTQWARASGVDCHETRLVTSEDFEGLPDGLPLGDGTVLLLTRFDRTRDGKVHVEDFGQILDVPPGPGQYKRSYGALGQVIRTLASDDVEEYIRRVAFMLISGNGDAHLKNWGMHYPDRCNPRLAPAYDLISTICRLPDDDLALELAGTRRWRDLSPERVAHLLADCHDDPDRAGRWFDDALDRAVSAFRQEAASFGFTAVEISTLEAHAASLLNALRPDCSSP